MKHKYMAKLKSALYGIVIAPAIPDDSELTLLKSLTNPPGYMIKMVLSSLYGMNLPRGGDKSEWQIPLTYKGETFLLEDYKRYKWKIYGSNNLIGAALEKKLISSANIFNDYIAEESKSLFEQDDFILHNNYHKIIDIYTEFYEQLKLIISEPPIMKDSKNDLNDITQRLSFVVERRRKIYGYLIATTVFFFAATEILLDACFAFGDRSGLSYKEFRLKDWSDRFKIFFDVSSYNNLTSDFQELLFIKRYYRNKIIHAEPVYLFHLHGFGNIPANYDLLNKPQMQPPVAIDESDVKNYLELYDRVFSYFSSEVNSKYAYIYVESGLPIPIRKKSAEELKRYMIRESDFKEEIRQRAMYQNVLDNMDI